MRRRSYRHWLSLVFSLAAVLQCATVFASSVGITGYSGKQGPICSTQLGCHQSTGPKAPTVTFDGPAEVSVQAMATFHFIVHSQAPTTQTYAGFNVAASGGTLSIGECTNAPTNCERKAAPEITHSAPHPNDANNEVSFGFTWQAPADPGTYILYGAGNSVNHNFLNTGDKPTATTFMINVVAAASPTPTSTDTPLPQPASPTSTDTPLPGTPTSTATRTDTPPATATPSDTPSVPVVCNGDCNDNHIVSADELLTGVAIALGVVPPECASFNANNDSAVTVDELLHAVNLAAGPCAAP